MTATSSPDAPKPDSPSQTDALIRSVIAEQNPVGHAPDMPRREPEGHAVTQSELPSTSSTSEQGSASRSARAGLQGYRPTRRHIIWAALALIVIWRPWLIPILLFISVWIALIAYLTVGPDRIAELLSSGWEKLSRRKPALAADLHASADRLALKLDTLLDRLPETWAEKLALPGLSGSTSPQSSLDDRPDPFDKLKSRPEASRG